MKCTISNETEKFIFPDVRDSCVEKGMGKYEHENKKIKGQRKRTTHAHTHTYKEREREKWNSPIHERNTISYVFRNNRDDRESI